MSLQATTRFEINLLNAKTKPQYVCEFARKHKIPALVASPEYIAPLIAYRAMSSSGFKIICALDFFKGDNFAMDKLFRSNPDFVAADGFDILLSPGRSEVESKNEMKSIYEYLKANRPLSEIRWVLNMHKSTDEVVGILKNMKNFPPSFVRVDPHLELPKIDIATFKEQISLIREHVPYPIKIGGNIDLAVYNEFKDDRNVKRFDVSMDQMETIVRGLKNTPKIAAV